MNWGWMSDLSSLEVVMPPAPPPPTIVGSAKATTPPTLDASADGDTVVIPVPGGTQSGDLLLALAHWEIGITTEPAGWTVVDAFSPATLLCSRTATSSEPADYTWTSDEADRGRSGAMLSLRGANPVLGESGRGYNTFTVPSLMNSLENSILVVFSWRIDIAPTMGEDYSANSPLVEQTQHVANGSAAYALPQGCFIAVEEGLSKGLISGRSFSHVDGPDASNVFGAIVEGV